MKSQLLALLLLPALYTSCEKNQLVPTGHDFINLDSVKITSYIKDNYYHDAKLLYTNEIYTDSTHFNRNNPVIDTSEVTKVLKIIQSVYDLDSQESRTVFETYKIHARLSISFNSFYLNVRTDKPEIINLAKGVIPTGNISLDNLLLTYKFDSVKPFYGYPEFNWLTIFTKNEYNLIPIVNMFSRLPSVLNTDMEKGSGIGDGNTIRLNRMADNAEIVFSIGKGDCPAGCTYHKYWVFNVSNNKSKFIRTYED